MGRQESIKWTKLACVIMTTLLGSADGVRYLTENKLLRQIADALIQLDPVGLLLPISFNFGRTDKASLV
jgi:hypothetical protein